MVVNDELSYSDPYSDALVSEYGSKYRSSSTIFANAIAVLSRKIILCTPKLKIGSSGSTTGYSTAYMSQKHFPVSKGSGR